MASDHGSTPSGTVSHALTTGNTANTAPSHNTAASGAGGVESIDVLQALRRLPSKMRLCVILAHVEDQSTASIATMLGCSTQNVDSQLRKGRQRLRTILGEGYTNQ